MDNGRGIETEDGCGEVLAPHIEAEYEEIKP